MALFNNTQKDETTLCTITIFLFALFALLIPNTTTNHTITYTKPIPCESLLEKGIYSSGTVRKTRRHFPNNLFQENTLSDQEDAPFYYYEHVTAVKWNERREVCALSTVLSNKLATILS